jgi:hypothetical protein
MSNNGTVKYRGIAFETGGQQYILPPATAHDAQELAAHLDVIGVQLKEGENLNSRLRDHYLPLIGAMLRKNYPEITDQEVAEWVTLDRLSDMLGVIMGSDKTAKVNVLPPGLSPVPEARPVGVAGQK